MRSIRPRRSGWLRWIFWLTVSVLIAGAAELWRAFSGPDWAAVAWLLPIPILLGIVFSALWQLLGSRRAVAPTPADRNKAGRRKIPRNPHAHLQELQRSGEYWAIMLRLPPDGACAMAQAQCKQVFDLYRAPRLPLDGCSSRSCKCGYSGLKNRRRRDVLPPGLDRDRRAGVVISWPAGQRPEPTDPRENTRPQQATSLAEGLRP